MRLTVLLLLGLCQGIYGLFFPLIKKEESIPKDLVPFEIGQPVPIDCISRQIDNGEHKFDDKEGIIYTAFPICKETGRPLSFRYGVSEDINCTIGFTDELYHLFQLYIHEDVPFSCRMPLSNEQHYLEKGGAYVPLTFNFRGDIHDSHLNIDNAMNVAITRPSAKQSSQNTIISAIAWSSGTNTTRIVIGNYMTIQLAVRWFDNLKNIGSQAEKYSNHGLPFLDGFYRLPMNYIPMSYNSFSLYLFLTALVLVFILGFATYKTTLRKLRKNGFVKLDNEAGYQKKD